jgi:hypothetical protein
MPGNIFARPEQKSLPNTLTQIVNDALHAAALAPTCIDALDIAGAALRAVADIARAVALHPGDSIRSTYAGRTGTVVKVYPDGSAAVRWDDGEPQPEGLAHERMPRRLLEVQHDAR